MTTEPTQPQPEQGPAPDNGQVQSQGHRRRRRRRKNKSSQQAADASQPLQGQPQMQEQPQPQAPLPCNPRRPSLLTSTRAGRRRNSSRRTQAPAAQPGNSISGPMQGKRKGRQKGPRAFVGPMDHSYRAVNGNVADGPPSTIQIMGGQRPRRRLLSRRLCGAARCARPPRRAHAHLLFHRGSVLPGQNSGDRAQTGREGGVREGR